MNLPFTTEQFLSVFAQYNLSVWPVQILLNLLGVGAVYVSVKRTRLSNLIVGISLAFLWLWIGLAYHFAFFATINPAARVFGVLNIIQGILFLTYGVLRQRLSFHFRPNFSGLTGALLILYALVLYPVLGYTFGHVYPKSPTFGLPCPTTIFTFGLLLWTDARVPRTLLIIPFLWSLVGYLAALTLGILEDTGLLVAGIVGTTLILFKDRDLPRSEPGIGSAA